MTHQSPEVITTHPSVDVGGLFRVLLLIGCQHVHNLFRLCAMVVCEILHQLLGRVLPLLCMHIRGQAAVAIGAV